MVKIYIKNEVHLWVMTGLGKYHWIGWLRHWGKVVMELRGQVIERIIFRHVEIMKNCDRSGIGQSLSTPGAKVIKE